MSFIRIARRLTSSFITNSGVKLSDRPPKLSIPGTGSIRRTCTLAWLTNQLASCSHTRWFSRSLSETIRIRSARSSSSRAAVQLSLIDAFVKAFEEAGISVPIDPLSGAIPIDSALLYDTDQYALTEEGKTALRTVFVPYYKVLSDPQYRDLIANVVIEGHTDTQGDYAYNQTLSERRAQAVYEYLLSEECGLEDTEFLRSILNVVGRSYDNPVYAADGSVDMAASRRVEIRFLLNLDA